MDVRAVPSGCAGRRVWSQASGSTRHGTMELVSDNALLDGAFKTGGRRNVAVQPRPSPPRLL